MTKKLKVNPIDFYPNLKENNYPEYLSDKPTSEHFEVGDLLYDEKHNAIGIVLGCIDYKGGELRLDSDGMQPIENLRYATKEDLDIPNVRHKDSLDFAF